MSPALAAVVDALLLIVFAAIGRRSHAEDSPVVGALTTAWPFLAGAAIGWLVCLLVWRRAPLEPRTGLVVWLCTVAGGMALRALTGQGTAGSFVVVASIVTFVFLMGWRSLARSQYAH